MIRNEETYRGKLYAFSRDLRRALPGPVVRLIATELFNVCNEVPVLFARAAEGEGWSVVGVVEDPGLRVPRLDEEGHWNGRYVPFVLRIHPFRPTLDGSAWDVAPEGLRQPGQPGRPFVTPDGTRTPEVERIDAMLREASQGMAQLSRQAAMLEAAGLLVPLSLAYTAPGVSQDVAGLFCIDRVRLSRMPAKALVKLVDAYPSALDLAFVSAFSMRLMMVEYSVKATLDLESRLAEVLANAVPAPATGGGAARVARAAAHRGAVAGAQPEAPPSATEPAPRRVDDPQDADAPVDFTLDGSDTIDFSTLLPEPR